MRRDRGSIGDGFDASVTFGAEIGDLENGKQVELRVSGGGFDHPLKGEIYRSTGEEGLNGVRVDIKPRRPLWAEMDEKYTLDYLVPGYGRSTSRAGATRSSNSCKTCPPLCRRANRRAELTPRRNRPARIPRRKPSKAPRSWAWSKPGKHLSPIIPPASGPT